MRMFELVRLEDENGVSGTGIVAQGVEFSDGSCALRWLSNVTSTAIYGRLADLIAIHGHGNTTRVRFI